MTPALLFSHRVRCIQVHWLSIINSFVLVVLLTVFLSIILVRVIKNDFTRCRGFFGEAPKTYSSAHNIFIMESVGEAWGGEVGPQ